jgi:O-antigen ligase
MKETFPLSYIAENLSIIVLAVSLFGHTIIKSLIPEEASVHKTIFLLAAGTILLTSKNYRNLFDRRLFMHPIVIWYGFLVLCMYFGLIATPTPEYGRYKADLMIWNILLLAWPFIAIKKPQQFRQFLLISLFVLIINSVLTLTRPLEEGVEFIDSRLAMGEVITAGRYYGTIVLLSIFTTIVIGKWLAMGCAIFGIICAILTETRGAIWPLLIVVFLIFYKRLGYKQGRGKIILGLLFCIFVFSVLPWDMLPNQFHEVFSHVFKITPTAIAESRSNDWLIGIELWKLSPLLGSGTGSYAWYYCGFDVRQYPHNMLIEVLAEHGLIGFTILIGLIVTTIRTILRLQIQNQFKNECLFVKYFFIYAFLTTLSSLEISNQQTFWVAVGLVFATLNWGNESINLVIERPVIKKPDWRIRANIIRDKLQTQS